MDRSRGKVRTSIGNTSKYSSTFISLFSKSKLSQVLIFYFFDSLPIKLGRRILFNILLLSLTSIFGSYDDDDDDDDDDDAI